MILHNFTTLPIVFITCDEIIIYIQIKESNKMKKCKKCGIDKNESVFYKNIETKDGLELQCKECRKKYSKKYYEENKDKRNNSIRIWRANNTEKLREWGKQWRVKNTENRKEYEKQWREKNKEKMSEYNKLWYEAHKNQTAGGHPNLKDGVC
jgi:hypothetical protein